MPHPNLQDVRIGRPVFCFLWRPSGKGGCVFRPDRSSFFLLLRGRSCDAAFFPQEIAGDRSRKGEGERHRPPTRRSFREKLSKRQAQGKDRELSPAAIGCDRRGDLAHGDGSARRRGVLSVTNCRKGRRKGRIESCRPPPSAVIVAAIWLTGTGPPAAIGCARDRGKKVPPQHSLRRLVALFSACAGRSFIARSGHERRRW